MFKRIFNLIIVTMGFLALALGILFVFDYYNIGIPCLFHHVTALYCPGCGLTRAFISLVQLDIITAVRMNALIIFLPIVIIYIIIGMVRYINNIKPYFLVVSVKVVYIILFFIIVFGIVRNIPGYEFLLPLK